MIIPFWIRIRPDNRLSICNWIRRRSLWVKNYESQMRKKISRTDSRSLVIWAVINPWQETSRMDHLNSYHNWPWENTVHVRVKFDKNFSKNMTFFENLTKSSNLICKLCQIFEKITFLGRFLSNFEYFLNGNIPLRIRTLKWDVSSQWQFGSNSAWGSIEKTGIGKTHPTLPLSDATTISPLNLFSWHFN